MAILDFTENGNPIVWQSADEKLRVIARQDTIGFDEDFYKSLSSDDFTKLQEQVEKFGMWVIDLEEKLNFKRGRGRWVNVDSIGGIIPDNNYKLQDAAQEYFGIDKFQPSGLFNWDTHNYRTRFAETFAASRYPYTEDGLVDLTEDHIREIFIETLNDAGHTDSFIESWNQFDGHDDTLLEIVMAHDKEDLIAYILKNQKEAPQHLGLFNWNSKHHLTRFAETFAASRRKRKPLNQTGVFNWWDETALWALKYDWAKLILLDNPEKAPYTVMRTTRNDTRKCSSCANRRSRRGGRENYGATVSHYNNGIKKFNYDSCNCGIYDTSGEKRRQKEVQKEMLRRGLVADMDKVHPDLRPAAAKWYLKKGKRNNPIPYWFHRESSHPKFFQRLLKRFTRRRGWFDWQKHNREKYMSENFSAPFVDMTSQETTMQIKHLYHGQHTVDGVEITPHSPYWTSNLDLALGHAMFGAEQEVAGATLFICKSCEGSKINDSGQDCFRCDEEGYILDTTFTDDILPQTTPIVLSLDFKEPQTVYFEQDIEHEKGVSYLIQNEIFKWEFVNSEVLLEILEKWLQTGIPELVEFDTGAGYVANEESVTKRIKQAISQLKQSAG